LYKGEAFLCTLKALDHMQKLFTHKLEDQKFKYLFLPPHLNQKYKTLLNLNPPYHLAYLN
jgi:hypothetical protein